MTGVKKFVNLKIFVLIMRTMKFVEWLGIDSGMLKLIDKIMNDFFGVILQYLEPPLKISTFHHMLDRVHISGKDLVTLLMIFTHTLAECKQKRSVEDLIIAMSSKIS